MRDFFDKAFCLIICGSIAGGMVSGFCWVVYASIAHIFCD